MGVAHGLRARRTGAHMREEILPLAEKLSQNLSRGASGSRQDHGQLQHPVFGSVEPKVPASWVQGVVVVGH